MVCCVTKPASSITRIVSGSNRALRQRLGQSGLSSRLGHRLRSLREFDISAALQQVSNRDNWVWSTGVC